MHSRCRQWMFSRKLILGSWLDGPLWKPGVTLDSSSLLREDRGSRHPSLAILRPHAHTCTYTYTLANWQTLGSLCCQWQDEVWPLKCNIESVSRLQRCLLSVLKVQHKIPGMSDRKDRNHTHAHVFEQVNYCRTRQSRTACTAVRDTGGHRCANTASVVCGMSKPGEAQTHLQSHFDKTVKQKQQSCTENILNSILFIQFFFNIVPNYDSHLKISERSLKWTFKVLQLFDILAFCVFIMNWK